ncbi:MAG: transcription antitermination factor NusB [Candidatus Coproplasma sp.]
MTNPVVDPYLILIKVYSGGKFLKQAISETPIEPLNKARTVKICYGVLEKDVYLNYVIAANTRTSPKTAVKVVLKIALYMLEFMDKHDYMVVDSAVQLVKKLGKGGAAGFVNAFLRSYKLPDLPERADEALSVKCSVPLWLAKKVKRSYKGEAEAILTAPSKGLCVRFERGEDAYLEREHTDTPFDGAYIFKNFVRDDGFFTGDYTFQSVGSIAICQAISPVERLLDACAAPGGKSVLLSKKCGEVVACEIHPHRVNLIEEYAGRMGAKNVEAKLADSTVFIPEYEEAFDAVLCDSPCSGTGVVNENPDILLNRREEDISSLCKVQAAILDNCSRYVKKGGKLYYSTCSVLPEENDSTVYNFLQKHPEYALDIPSSPLENRRTPFGLQFLPHISLGAGFFVTSLVKL